MSSKLEMIKLIIPGEPIAKGRPRVTRRGTFTPTKTKNYETLIKELYIAKVGHPPLERELAVDLQAFFAIPKSASKKKRALMISETTRPTKKPDIDNVLKSVTDALNGLAYNDDKQIVEATIGKYYSENPRVEITISQIEKGELS